MFTILAICVKSGLESDSPWKSAPDWYPESLRKSIEQIWARDWQKAQKTFQSCLKLLQAAYKYLQGPMVSLENLHEAVYLVETVADMLEETGVPVVQLGPYLMGQLRYVTVDEP
jgi:hypothetical protein